MFLGLGRLVGEFVVSQGHALRVGVFGWLVGLLVWLWGMCLLVDAYGCSPDFDLSISVLIQSGDGGVPVLGGFLSQ